MINQTVLQAAFVNRQPPNKSSLSHVSLTHTESLHNIYKKEKKELFVKFEKHEVPHKRIWIPCFFNVFLKIRRTNLEAAFLNGIRCVAGALLGPACVFSFAIPSVPHGQPELFSSSVFRAH